MKNQYLTIKSDVKIISSNILYKELEDKLNKVIQENMVGSTGSLKVFLNTHEMV